MSYIYVISSGLYRPNVYKIGYHTGSESKLRKRYYTSLGIINLHLFLETKNHRKVEKEIFVKLDQYRIKGNKRKPECFEVELHKIKPVVYDMISKHGEFKHKNPDKSRCTII